MGNKILFDNALFHAPINDFQLTNLKKGYDNMWHFHLVGIISCVIDMAVTCVANVCMYFGCFFCAVTAFLIAEKPKEAPALYKAKMTATN